MAGTRLKAQRDTGQLLVMLHQCHPVLNRRIQVVFQDGGHALRKPRPASRVVREFVAKSFPKNADFDWLGQDFVSL